MNVSMLVWAFNSLYLPRIDNNNMANARTDEVGTTLNKRSWVRRRSSKLVQHVMAIFSRMQNKISGT
jgi:hypothetical protein